MVEFRVRPHLAGVAQLVERLIRNQQVRGSSPRAGSNISNQISIKRSGLSLCAPSG
jgi:hypothetical protein